MEGVLVAGGGFVPQPHVDSVQLAESTIVRNAKKGYKGKCFHQFSFNLRLSSFRTNSCLDPLLRGSLREVYRRERAGVDGKLLKQRDTDGYRKRFR
jgi:hypothetical protein